MEKRPTMKTFVEINKENLLHNLDTFRNISGKPLMFVVKGNAYGHGLKEIVNLTKDLAGIEYYAVDSLDEALYVKRLSQNKKILVLGWADREEIIDLIANDIEMVAPSVEYLEWADTAARTLNKRARCQVKLETGTNRLGMTESQLLEVLRERRFDNIDITGIYSHFANIEDTSDHSYAREQLKRYNDFLDKIGNRRLLRHFSCSASTLLFPKTYFDIVRVGISAYGYWPSKQTYVTYLETMKRPVAENGDGARQPISLKPVLSWHTHVAQVKEIEKGQHIGYGLTYRTFGNSRMIVVPVGYYDGYDRKLSNTANIIVNGQSAPVRGRVCMNMFMAETTHIEGVNAGDRVTLLGSADEERITADHLGEWSGTINYEILARINPRLPRVVV